MKYLLDASALVPLLSEFGEKLIVKAAEERLSTTDLAVYEAGNSLWKLSTLLRLISLEDAVEAMDVLKGLTARGIIYVVGFEELNLASTLRLAGGGELTFYDASYIVAAENMGAILVTEDEKLREAASKRVNTTTYTDFKRKVAPNRSP
ncbi:MAG: Exonuclease VapC9 [Candidatus Bathyarchaeota archaeon BA1]|nr:MAG: Exonuclease VapC9 [Candidatus Bathyarchaeota archaeon BA1]